MKIVYNVYEYLKELSNLREKKKFVFRGETRQYPNGCMPGIFRKIEYQSDRFFESKIIDKYSSRFLDNQLSYLCKAMDLQHGGFPSRLLDVSFNSLVALHFAITPHFTEKIDSDDDKDGIVYVINCESLSSPNSIEVSKMFDRAISRQNSVFESYSHFMIDHMAINERIKVQNGGFLLFLGEDFRDIDYLVENKIIISKSAKKQLRCDLLRLFGIDNGFVYPESDHLVTRFLEDISYYNNSNYDDELSFLLGTINQIPDRFRKNLHKKFEKIMGNEIFDFNSDEHLKHYPLQDDKYESLVLKDFRVYLESRKNTSQEREKFVRDHNSRIMSYYRKAVDIEIREILEFLLDFEITFHGLIKNDYISVEKLEFLVNVLGEKLDLFSNETLLSYSKRFGFALYDDFTDILSSKIKDYIGIISKRRLSEHERSN